MAQDGIVGVADLRNGDVIRVLDERWPYSSGMRDVTKEYIESHRRCLWQVTNAKEQVVTHYEGCRNSEHHHTGVFVLFSNTMVKRLNFGLIIANRVETE